MFSVLFLFVCVLGLENSVASNGPIMVSITPDVTWFSVTTHHNLTCTASGVNLPKLREWDLAWYEQVDGGSNREIIKTHNGTSVSMDRNLTLQHQGSTVYCVLIFNRLTPKHYAQLRGHYVTIEKAVKYENPSYTAIISSAVAIGFLIVMLLIAGFLYRKKIRGNNNKPSSFSQEPSTQEPAYYAPIQQVPLYEEKAMAAANQSPSIRPPPLPARNYRSKRVDDENEYVYASMDGGVTPTFYAA